MKNKKHLSMLLACAMIFNLFAFSGSAEASVLIDNTAYMTEDDTSPYIIKEDTKVQQIKNRTILDISRGDITIFEGSVTAKTPNGSAAAVNPNGYEIIGNTSTNKIEVNDGVPITINGITLNYTTNNIGSAINMVSGGDITLVGTNKISRVDQIADDGLIGQDSGFISIDGSGNLTIEDGERKGTTIGGNAKRIGKIRISGDVIINATKVSDSESPIIGSGYANNRNATITITGNTKLNASIDGVSTAAVIGTGSERGGVDITISGKAQVIATGGTGDTTGAVVGIGDNASAQAYITIEDGTYLKVVSRSTATITDAIGMGMPELAPIASDISDRADVQISFWANVHSPVREKYYKSLADATTPVYRATAMGLEPNINVSILYARETKIARTDSEGTLYLYLPTGIQKLAIDGVIYQTNVTTNGMAVFTLDKDSIKTVIDIGKSPITISKNSVTAKTPEGIEAQVDPDGYEIVGSTTTNTISVNNAVDIAIRDVTMDYSSADIVGGINLVDGGAITVLGTNTINRNVSQNADHALIGQNSGEIQITGSGILNITDNEGAGTTIGGNYMRPGNVYITGSVTINANRTNEQNYGAVIGAGYGVSATTIVGISGTANVNASIDGVSTAAVIGHVQGSAGSANITISGEAQLIATGGVGNTTAAVIGTANANATANIIIENASLVKIVNRSTAESAHVAGMGIPENTPITSDMISKANIRVASSTNINAPARENYYKNLLGITPVYKTVVSGLAENKKVALVYEGTSTSVKTFADGGLSLYLPLGEQVATIDGDKFETLVNASGHNKMLIKTLLTADKITAHVSKGAQGIDIKGHAITNSKDVAVTYTILNAGNTGAVLNGTQLNWSMPGTVIINMAQVEFGKYSSANANFTIDITTNPGDVHIEVSVDTSSAGFGSIIVTNTDNKEITPFVQPGEEITITAIADEGYDLEKWVKTTTTIKGAREIITEDLPATPSLKIIAQANVGYTAYFIAQETVPKLSVLQVSAVGIGPDGTLAEQKKPLIRQDGSESVKFDPDKLEYGLYLRSIDTNNITVYVRHSDTKKVNIKIGDSAVAEVIPFREYKASITLKDVAYQEIPVVASKGISKITYVIKVFKPQKAENDPHIFAELEINPVKEVLELGVYAMNVDVNSFSTTIKIDESLASKDKAFASFVNNKGVAFNDLGINLAGSLDNYFNLDSRFEVADIRSDGTFLHLTVNIIDGNEIIKFGSVPEKILSINVRRNPDYKGNVIDEIDTLKVETVTKGKLMYGNSLSSKFYGDLNDTFKAIRAEDEKTLSYLVFKGKYDTIKMYVGYDANIVGRVTFEIVDVSTPGEHKVATAGDLVEKEIVTKVIQSIYKVRVLAGGYLLAESEDIVYDGDPSKYGIVMTPIRLLEGDIDGNERIDALDRTKLIRILNQNVLLAGSGFVTLAGEDIYGDYNNDNKINSLDLGRLVYNIGRQYSPIHKS